MDDPTYTVTFNYDDPTNQQVFNAEGKYFPDRLTAQTGFKINHRAKEYSDFDNKTVGPLSLATVATSKLYAKPVNNPLTPIELCDGTVTDAALGLIEFIVPSDTLSNSLSQFTEPGNPLPIVLYWIITDTSNNKKISLETNVRVMDINRDGNQESTSFTASDIGYSVEQASKWTGQYWSQPTGVAEALDKLARVDHTDRGSILSQLAAQPVSPTDADKHLATATAGDWTSNYIYEWNSIAGVWLEHVPREGDEIYDKNTNTRLRWDTSTWASVGADLVNDTTPQLGGDLDLNGFNLDFPTTPNISDVLDEDNMVSDSATALATQQSIKAYADTKLANVVEDTTPQLGGALDTNSKQINLSKGADVASAGTLTLGTDGNYFDITGTTTITSIATLGIGTQVTLHFDGALTLTHHATDLILPSGANITTAAGDEFTFVEYASGDWRCIGYALASGEAVIGGSGNFPTATDSGDKTTAYTVVSGDVNTAIIVGSATTADFDITLDVSLFSATNEVITVVNESAYIARVVVSNTGTMTINSQYTDRYVSAGQTVTFSGDTSTNCRMVAGA